MRRTKVLVLLGILAALVATIVWYQLEPAAPDYSDYERWSAKPDNAKHATKLNDFLRREGVNQVVPLHQLLRSDVKWKICGAEPFSVPPEKLWPNMVPTLETIRDEVIPLIGQVEAMSVFRTEWINGCIGGATSSFHMRFRAIDMRPVRHMSRKEMISKLCSLHKRKGTAFNMGLGIYGGTRFHVDTAGFRTWGHDYKAGTSPCRSIVAPQHILR